MSGLRGLIPATVAIGLGIFTGYYTFHPAIQQLNAERQMKNQSNFQVANDQSKEPSISTVSQNSASSEKSGWSAKPVER